MAATDRIFLAGLPQFRFLLLAMARQLRERFGAEIHLYCTTEQEAQFWNERGASLFASVTVRGVRYEAAARPVADADAVLARARVQEEWLNVTINELALTDRHLGRGYALAGFNHPRSRYSEGANYIQMVNAFSAEIEFWRSEIEAKRPTLLIDCGKVAAVIARKLGLPYRALAGSRHKNLHQWAENEFFENVRIERAFHRLAEAPGESEIAQPYYSHMTLRRQYSRQTTWPRLLWRTARLLLSRAYRKSRGYKKSKGYYAWSEVRYLWMRKFQLQQLRRLSVPLAALEGRPFVYFPLHTEPETALQTLSPEYFYQLSCIAALSRDLPAGVILAVKETFEATGRRPGDFYRQICELKNVVMIDMMELGLEVARRARVVATITGTGGFEAAVMGKPVIAFGRHNQYNFLPHVAAIVDEAELKSRLKNALDPAFDAATARRDGARFLAAVTGVSFDLRGYDYINLERFEASAVDDAVDALAAGLDVAAPVRAPRAGETPPATRPVVAAGSA